MASRKAAAAADSQKKRKRDKAEDVVRLKKRKGQAGEEETAASSVSSGKKSGGAARNSKLAQPTARAIADQKTTWKLSEPMGGAMADIDPVFSNDEEYAVTHDPYWLKLGLLCGLKVYRFVLTLYLLPDTSSSPTTPPSRSIRPQIRSWSAG